MVLGALSRVRGMRAFAGVFEPGGAALKMALLCQGETDDESTGSSPRPSIAFALAFAIPRRTLLGFGGEREAHPPAKPPSRAGSSAAAAGSEEGGSDASSILGNVGLPTGPSWLPPSASKTHCFACGTRLNGGGVTSPLRKELPELFKLEPRHMALMENVLYCPNCAKEFEKPWKYVELRDSEGDLGIKLEQCKDCGASPSFPSPQRITPGHSPHPPFLSCFRSAHCRRLRQLEKREKEFR
jgi:hypothetical protein